MRLSGEGVTPFRESEMLGNEKSAGHGEEFLQNTSQFLWFPGVTQTQPSRITMMKTKLTLFVTVLASALFGVCKFITQQGLGGPLSFKR